MAYSFLAKLTFVYKKLQMSEVEFNKTIVEKMREKML
jgi:hypothetical protein